MYLFSRHIDSARFSPMAFTRMRTCPGPASGTSTFLNLNTSGPPASENSTTRDIYETLALPMLMMILRHLHIQPLHCLMLCRTDGPSRRWRFRGREAVDHEVIVCR